MTERAASVGVEQDKAAPDPDAVTPVAEPSPTVDEADLPTDPPTTAGAGTVDGPEPTESAESTRGEHVATRPAAEPGAGPAVPGEPTAAEATAAARTAAEPPGPVKVDGADAGETPDPEEVWGQFAPEPERTPTRVSVVARRAGRFLSHEWTLATLAAIVVAVVMTWPTALHPSTTIPADIWDPTLQAWQMAWAGHAVLHDPLHLWNANAFYPELYSYTFSDTLLGYFPAGLIGTGPGAALVRYNIMFVLLHVLAFLGPYALVRQLGARRTAAAVAGVAFAYAPWRWGQAGHMHVLSDGGIPLALAMLARGHGYSLIRGFRPELVKPWWAFAGWCVVAWQISLGFGIGLPFAYILGLVCLVVAVRWLARFLRDRPVPTWRVLLADGLGLAVFGAVAALMALPYLQVVKLHPEAKRSVADLKVFSPDLRAFITAPAQSWLWGDAHDAARATMTAPAETTLLPGFMLYRAGRRRAVLLQLATGDPAVAAGRDRGQRGLRHGHRVPRRPVHLRAAVRARAGLGGDPHARPVGRLDDVAADHPRRRCGRCAARPLVRAGRAEGPVPAQPRGSGWPRCSRSCSCSSRARTSSTTRSSRPSRRPCVPSTGPLMVLPSDQLNDENVMIWSTTKFQPMVNGGSGFYPVGQTATREAVKSFPDQASVDYLRHLGVKTVLVVKSRAAGTDYARAAALDVPVDDLGITREDAGDTLVYTLS